MEILPPPPQAIYIVTGPKCGKACMDGSTQKNK